MASSAVEQIKSKIIDGHRRGVCNKNGQSFFTTDNSGRRGPKPVPSKGLNSSAARTYVFRDGKMVLKE